MKQKDSDNKKTYFFVLCIFLVGISFLVYSGFTSNAVYFLNVSEALADNYAEPKKMRLFGTVESYKSHDNEKALSVHFSLLDKDDPSRTILVRYAGIIPDAFKIGAEVIAEGEILPDHTFNAKIIMTKCPSKYQKENRRIS